MRDPVAAVPVAEFALVLEQLAADTLLEQLSHIRMLGERHMRAFVPDKTIAVVAIDMPSRVAVALEEDAVLMTEMIRATKTG